MIRVKLDSRPDSCRACLIAFCRLFSCSVLRIVLGMSVGETSNSNELIDIAIFVMAEEVNSIGVGLALGPKSSAHGLAIGISCTRVLN